MVLEIRVGHTPDADDAFMFYAIEKELIPMGDFKIIHQVDDIEKLNKQAISHELEVTAISAHALAFLKDYKILNSGGSFGINYGPIIISYKKSLDDISNKHCWNPWIYDLCLSSDVDSPWEIKLP